MTQFGLTRRQAECLEAIRSAIQDRGIPPSYEELRQTLGYRSKSQVARHVNALEERGHLRTKPGRNRSMVLVGPENDVRRAISAPAAPAQPEPVILDGVTAEEAMEVARASIDLAYRMHGDRGRVSLPTTLADWLWQRAAHRRGEP